MERSSARAWSTLVLRLLHFSLLEILLPLVVVRSLPCSLIRRDRGLEPKHAHSKCFSARNQITVIANRFLGWRRVAVM